MYLRFAFIRLSMAVMLLALFTRNGVPSALASNVVPTLSSNQHPVEATFDQLPLLFTENVGQFDSQARFVVQGMSSTLYLTDNALWFTIAVPGKLAVNALTPAQRTSSTSPRQASTLNLSFSGANVHPRIEAFQHLDTVVSYFSGHGSANWHSAVPVWGGVRYHDLYSGIDLELSSLQGHLVPRLIVRDGADLNAVHLRVEGVNAVTTDGDALQIETSSGNWSLPLLLVDTIPSAQPTIQPSGAQSFDISAPFAAQTTSAPASARSAAPVDLLYGTFLGGSDMDVARGIAVDQSGAAYITGDTSSADFPSTPGAFHTSIDTTAYSTAFVAKLNPAGTALEYATFFGGSRGSVGMGIAVDNTGSAYVAGATTSPDFPVTAGAFDTSFNSATDVTDAFIAKLNPTGTALSYATFVGGFNYDLATGIALDSSGAAYVTGQTEAADFPVTAGAFDTTFNGGIDVFALKINPSGSVLDYALFIGGSGLDSGRRIAVDQGGTAYLIGQTFSSDFPTTPGAYDTTFNNAEPWYSDAFVVKLTSTGSSLAFATFLGGASSDEGSDISVSADGVAYVTGTTSSTDFPTTPGAFNTTPSGFDAFVAKLTPNGSALTYATFLGSSSTGRGIAVDSTGAAYITGYTVSPEFPTTPNAYDTSFNGGENDAYLVTLAPSGDSLSYATFIGGAGDDTGSSVALGLDQQAYIIGQTGSADFPTTPGAYNTTFNGFDDIFVVKLGATQTSAPPSLALRGGACPSPSSATATLKLHVSDADTSVNSLTLRGVSSNPNVVPASSIVFAGSGAERTVTFATLPSKTRPGSSILTITVSDGERETSLLVKVLVGTPNDDALTGEASMPNVIFGLAGQDKLTGGMQDDLMCGGTGDNQLIGMDGADTLIGGPTQDRLEGGNGDDTLVGGDGDDLLLGNSGSDKIDGQGGNDMLSGGDGDDSLRGGSGADRFSGGSGTDVAIDLTPNEGDSQDGTIP